MNAAEYQEYLNTEHWQTMRRLALEHAEHRCQLCYAPDRLQVHHRTYERVTAERLTDLTVLCDGCHEEFHRRVQLRQIGQGIDLGSLARREETPKPVNRSQYLVDLARGAVKAKVDE